ncbi:spermidine/putrescine transport system permease protein [Mumia flava]|uniref:Spermidine/putrescine transport system permease protein n=1 Tax=Mumia flava TaxID=1348852 RepID=A0A0B2BTJ0_9ACTN|nr:ABC transporter permease [Mumia flava]PJJ57977.1 spermidine/putrescine transport system permease protein [Mumia flava]
MSATTQTPDAPASAPVTRTRRRSRRPGGGSGWLSLPVWFWLVFFILTPLALVFWYSFGYKPDLFTSVATDAPSFDRYREVTDPVFMSTFWDTLRIAAIGTTLCAVIGVPFAYWMGVKVDPRWRPLLLALVLVPFWTNFLVRTLGWQIILSPEGFLSHGLQKVGILSGPLDVLYTSAAVQLGVVYNYLPLMILPLYVVFERLDPAQREASRDLGAGRWRTFGAVTLPSALPGIAAGALLVFIPLMGDYLTASVLGGSRGTMVGQMIARQFNTAQDWALGSAMAFTLMAFVLLTVVVVGLVFLAVRALLRRARHLDLEGAR